MSLRGKNMAKISDAFPVLDVSIVLNGDISQTSTEELVKDKNVILVGVPGAFTPTCHLCVMSSDYGSKNKSINFLTILNALHSTGVNLKKF